MASLTKRHQARNERALQDLIKSVPGNDRCADCQARNPGWASWSLGVFLCMRCAALHRKLGTHISKVKSLSMDSWSSEQVDNMRKVGNASSNRTYNPSNTRPPVPLDVDEVDSAMERFIRQKYVSKEYSSGAPVRAPAQRVNTGDTASSEDRPPPPPPKPGRKFGFGLRSSSALPLSGGGKEAQPSPKKKQEQLNKQSRVFGAAIGVREEGMEWKLVTLKEMGFSDDKRNLSVLKGLGGDLERAIESLVRLGEGPSTGRTPQSSRGASGTNSPDAQDTRSQSFGASVQASKPTAEPAPRAVQSATQATFPTARSYNPFDVDAPSSAPLQQTGLENQLQQLNMNPSQPPPLFPNATGGHSMYQEQLQQARLQQSMTPPPMPHSGYQYPFNNPYAQQPSHNPFLQASPQPSPSFSNNPYLASQPAASSLNPFFAQNNLNAVLSSPSQTQFQQPAPVQQQHSWPIQSQTSPSNPVFNNESHSPALQPSPFLQQQQQPQFQSQLPVFAPQTMFTAQANYGSQPSSPAPYQSFQSQQPQQPQTLLLQRTGRIDKSSILALYNYPHLAPSPTTTGSVASSPSHPATPTAQPSQPVPAPSPLMMGGAPLPAQQQQQQQQPPQRSVTMPLAGSKNPFLAGTGAAAPGAVSGGGGGMAGAGTRMSEAVEDGAENGRHSPDAFASLSARFTR